MSPEEIFSRFFLPLYPDDLRGTDPTPLAVARRTEVNPGGNEGLFAHLDDAADGFVANAARLFGADIGLDRSDESIHRLSAALSRERRDAWASEGERGTAANVLFNAVVHGAAYVGACIAMNHAGQWGVRRPLWESVVRLKSRAGEGDLPMFHWWLKSLTDDALTGAAATLADRYRTHVELACAHPEALPVIFVQPRSLPRLERPTYDRLHKYVRAHLPEIRDLGSDFPTPERFAELSFRWAEFHLVGGGRGVLLAGATAHGLHVFWLGRAGFEKSAFFPSAAIPGPIVRVTADRVVVMTGHAGQTTQTHEMLWWGP